MDNVSPNRRIGLLISGLVLVLSVWILGRELDRLEALLLGEGVEAWVGETPLDFTESEKEMRRSLPPGPVENVILLVADGMGFGQLTIARNALVGPRGRLEMERTPVVGWVSTHQSETLYTDSAATATALASGHKTNYGAVGVDASGRAVVSLAEAMHQAGGRVGLITDSYLWDATPSAFVAHVPHRSEHDTIAHQMAASGLSLLVGGLTPGWTERRELFVARGWRVADDFTDWSQDVFGGESPTVATFPDLGAASDPSLLEVAEVAVAGLQGSANGGFFLLIETEETDTGSHRHDLKRVVEGVRSLDAVAHWAFDFAERHGRTLVLVTSDHDTAAPVVLRGNDGEPQEGRWSSSHHTAQPVPLFAYGPGAERLAGVRDNTEIPKILAELLGLDLESARGQLASPSHKLEPSAGATAKTE